MWTAQKRLQFNLSVHAEINPPKKSPEAVFYKTSNAEYGTVVIGQLQTTVRLTQGISDCSDVVLNRSNIAAYI